jgi:hypothetical protein
MFYSRNLGRAGALALLGGLTLSMALPGSGPADAAPGFDGNWSVVILTREGICDPSYRYPIRIVKGHVVNGGNASVSISGTVQRNGAVTVHVSTGDKTATGTGRLAAASGGGSWSGGNGACSGVWQAERRG